MKDRKVYVAAALQDVMTKWLWEPYIPSGKVTMLHGEEGVGKSLLGIKLMSACTSRVKMDRYGSYLDRGRCLYLTKEENLAEVIKPKLKGAGANLEDILMINDKVPITLADDSLKNIIMKNQIRLVVIDPFSSYLENKESLYDNPGAIYPIIHKLDMLAGETGCAIVLIEESEGFYSGQSKVWREAFGSCISSYLCLTWEDDRSYEERVLYHEVSFLSLEGDPVDYELNAKGLKCV